LEYSTGDIKTTIISDGIGEITESDINLALTSKAVVLAFRVPTPLQVQKLAGIKAIKISKYDIIYQLIDDVTAALEGMLEPEIIETTVGRLEVLKIFYKQKDSGIVGGRVKSGTITPGTKIVVKRDDEIVGELKTEGLKVGVEKTDKVKANTECGVSYKGDFKVKVGDIFEFNLVEEKLRSLKKRA